MTGELYSQYRFVNIPDTSCEHHQDWTGALLMRLYEHTQGKTIFQGPQPQGTSQELQVPYPKSKEGCFEAQSLAEEDCVRKTTSSAALLQP